MLATSEAQVREFAQVVQYEQLQKYLSAPVAQMMLDNLRRKASVFHSLPDVDISPDPDDNPILATALAAQADYLVSGDKKHLLSLGGVEGVPIITARAAVDALK